MSSKEAWRRYLEMGATVGELTLARAEQIARDMTAEDQQSRERAWREVEQLTRFGLRIGEQLLEVAKERLSDELRTRSADTLERLADRVGDLWATGASDEAARAGDGAIPVVASETTEGVRMVSAGPALGAAGRPQPEKNKNKAKKKTKKRGKGADAQGDDRHRAAVPAAPGRPTKHQDKRRRDADSQHPPRAKNGKDKNAKDKKDKEPSLQEPAPVAVLALAREPGFGALP